MKVTWSPQAIDRVLEISEYIALDKPGAALKWAESVFQSTERLVLFPESGRMVPELGRPEVREILHGGYRILYRLDPGQVSVLTVRSSRELLDLIESEP